ncbi:hypothetical protein AAY77_01680, partial [Providencia rettgeri]
GVIHLTSHVIFFSFDTREKVLLALGAATKEQVIEYYENAVIKRKGLALTSQVIGQGVDAKSGFAQLKDWVFYPTASELQKILPIKEDAE